MKRFNQYIAVEVSVDSIAKKLYSSMDPSNPNAELTTETVIELLLEREGLPFLYNSLHGWKDELNFKEGETYLIGGKELDFYNFDATNNLDNLGVNKESIFEVKVTKVSEYRTSKNKIEVSYTYWQTGKTVVTTSTTWVNHLALKVKENVAVL